MAYREATAAATANTITATYAVTASQVGTGAVSEFRLQADSFAGCTAARVKPLFMEIQALKGSSSAC